MATALLNSFHFVVLISVPKLHVRATSGRWIMIVRTPFGPTVEIALYGPTMDFGSTQKGNLPYLRRANY